MVDCWTSSITFLYLFLQVSSSEGAYSDIFIHTYARVIFLGFKTLNFNIFGVFRKMNIFLG